MKLSRKFLNDYITLDSITTEELADKMVRIGNEYESVKKLSDATNVVVGEVLECVSHPESKKLHICKIDTGDQVQQILCGAPNIAEGQKVVVAKIGAILPGGIEIKQARLAGMESNGMVCSLGELGIESKYISEEEKTGIHVLPKDAKVGEDAIAYLGYDDEVVDFELTANRADLMNILGMAYEVGAIYGKEVTLPENTSKEQGADINQSYTLSVKTDNCPIYLGKRVENVVIKESPEFLKNRLMASGIRPINNVVDISNYVMLEYGQPLHFFDADRLGNHLIVRMAEEGEVLVTLDGKSRLLHTDNLVIANDKEAVALAGVMGGLSTEIESDTKNIFIESAIFDAVNIRKTSKEILRSEASMRYEKGIDPSRTVEALKRACYLLEKYADATVTKGILTHDTIDKKEKEITVSLEFINRVLGMNLAKEEVEAVFKNLQFQVKTKGETFTVFVPTRRLDIHIKEDLAEEVGRIYGYDQLVGTLPVVAMKRGKRSAKATIIKEIKERLTSLGLQQVITYSLVSEKEATLFVQETYETICLKDPMSEDKKVMRQSLIPSLLKVFDYNLARNQKDIAIYEVGTRYIKEEDYQEKTLVSGLLYGTYISNLHEGKSIPYDFYTVKGIVENLLHYLGFQGRYEYRVEALKDLHPGRSARIYVDHTPVGFLGQIHPTITKKEVYTFELELDILRKKKVREIKSKEVPKYPEVVKDMAFVVKKETTAAELMKVMKKASSRTLVDIDVFDVYVGDNLGENEKSIAFKLTFQDKEKTLTEEEVLHDFHHIIEEVEAKLEAKLRNN